MRVRERARANRFVSVAYVLKLSTIKSHPFALIDVKLFAIEILCALDHSKLRPYNMANCTISPLWTLFIQRKKHIFFIFRCFVCHFSTSLVDWIRVLFDETLKFSVDWCRKHLCLNRSVCVPLRYIAHAVYRLPLNCEREASIRWNCFRPSYLMHESKEQSTANLHHYLLSKTSKCVLHRCKLSSFTTARAHTPHWYDGKRTKCSSHQKHK